MMIIIDNPTGNVVQIILPKTVTDEDFTQIAPQIDELVRKYGDIRLLVDASGFNGWINMAAFKRHTRFARAHLYSVVRIALITGHFWQRWLAGIIKRLVRQQIEIFDKKDVTAAQRWIVS